MKKFIKGSLSVFVILTMIFTLCSPAFALKNVNIQILENSGVIPAENFSDNKIITRAEFIKMAVTLLYDDVMDVRYDSTPFADVSAENEYCQYIGAAYSNGLISGMGGACFYPDMPMKYIDAVKIMTDALGYGTVVKLEEGYEKGYAYMAAKINLSTKALALAQTELTGMLAKELLHDSLDVFMADTSFTSNGEYTLHNSGITLMKALGIYYAKGVLSANEYTGFYDISGAGESSIKVGGITASIYNSMDDEKYLGYNVECYYREKDGKNMIVSMLPTGANDVTVIAAENFESYSSDAIKYHREESNKLDEVRLNNKFFVVFNGRVKDDYTKETFDIKEGTITAIDNSGDGYADIVNIRSYDNYIITGLDTVDMLVYDRYGKILDLSEDSRKSVVIADGSGNEMSFDKLAKNQILSVMADKEFNYIRIMASGKKVSGTISALSDEDTVTVEGAEYKLSECIPDTEKAEYTKLSQKGTFYIDAFGKIAYFAKDTTGPLYSMIIDKDEGTGLNKAAIKFVDVNSAVRISTVSKKCKVNGVKAEKPADVCAAVSKKEMVIIELNRENEITSIETADGDVLNAINDVESLTYGGTGSFGTKLTISSTTPVFIYPSGESTEEDEYYVWNRSYLPGVSVDVQGFNTKKESYLPDVVTVKAISKKSQFIKYNSTNLVVNKLRCGTDIEGEDIYILFACTFGGEERRYKIPADVLSGTTLNPGDMIKISTDRSGKARAVDKFYDSASGTIASGSKFASAGTTAGFKPMVGYVYEFKNSFLGFTSAAGDAGYNDVIYYSASDVSVSVLEVENKDVSIKSGSSAMLTDYVTSKNPSKVFMYSTDGLLKKIIILK